MKNVLVMTLVLSMLVALSACTIPAGDRANDQAQAPSASTTTSSGTAGSSATTTATTTTTTTSSSKSTTSTSSSAAQITRDRAIELALQAAGLTRDKVRDLEAELDREREGLFWEVDFETQEYEYSYDIHAETGTVAKVEREKEDRD